MTTRRDGGVNAGTSQPAPDRAAAIAAPSVRDRTTQPVFSQSGMKFVQIDNGVENIQSHDSHSGHEMPVYFEHSSGSNNNTTGETSWPSMWDIRSGMDSISSHSERPAGRMKIAGIGGSTLRVVWGKELGHAGSIVGFRECAESKASQSCVGTEEMVTEVTSLMPNTPAQCDLYEATISTPLVSKSLTQCDPYGTVISRERQLQGRATRGGKLMETRRSKAQPWR